MNPSQKLNLNLKLKIKLNLFKAISIQITLILLAALVGVYTANRVVEGSLLKKALQEESEYFWKHFLENPNHPVPNTLNLQGYLYQVEPNSHLSNNHLSNNHQANNLQALNEIPLYFADLNLGYQKVQINNRNPLVHVSQKSGKRLYLILDEDEIMRLSFYFGLAPLAVVLLILYGILWLSHIITKRTMSPIINLAKQIQDLNPNDDFATHLIKPNSYLNSKDEITTLYDTLIDLNNRLRSFIHRERQFTRDASHELRTPLSIIKGSIEYLERFSSADEKCLKTLKRMHETSNKMEKLIDTLLTLAREDQPNLPSEHIDLNLLIKNLLEEFKNTDSMNALDIEYQVTDDLKIFAPEKIVNIILSNIISNAFKYTPSGSVHIELTQTSVIVKDTGIGISSEDLKRLFRPFFRGSAYHQSIAGQGLGLSIVKRLCDQYHWKIKVHSVVNEGSTFEIVFVG